MMAPLIFSDRDCTEEAGDVLYEGREYFILLPDLDGELIEEELKKAKLTGFISWSRHNRVASLKLVNRIGFIRLFGKVFDVRSEKFFEGLTGPRQFECLLDDLTKLSRHIIFDHSSPTSAFRTHMKSTGASVLERFNYYWQRFFKDGCRDSIEYCVESVIRSPHSRLSRDKKEAFIWNVRYPTEKTMRSMVGPNRHLATFPEGPDNRGFPEPWTAVGRGWRFLPLRVTEARSAVDHDTAENRFVKHVLADIEQVCMALMAQSRDFRVQDDCKALLRGVRRWLRHPFFFNIGCLDYFPYASPTLVSRHGYRELYAMFLRSRNGARHLFDDMMEESSFMDLKDVAQLYEYWIFYRVAVALLGEHAVVEYKDVVVKNGSLAHAIEVSNGNIRIAFNKTYGRGANASYSLRFRPDICVTVGSGGDDQLFLLDAKYRSVEKQGEPDEILPSIRGVKADDLHKMHCYMDAIEGSQAAIVIYPGNQAVFYPRDRGRPVSDRFPPNGDLEGVGAAPLTPGVDSADFEALMHAIKGKCATPISQAHLPHYAG